MSKVEILAPAGGLQQLEAAVRCGADAVYFGASSFNARRNAENFTDEDFLNAVRYCHGRGVKVYITLNTLIKDSEAEEFQKTLELIAKSSADAVIVQDMAVFSRVKYCCPDIPVHASTQMAVHNKAGARLLEKLGFSRVVLARELSLNEIKEITSAVSIETEVFVHGAHCMSASGMCYMSSFIGARSGNRGLCAQPCRLNFRYKEREYALSLKDMCLADSVDELIAAGVCSLKIEGRMKRPEYVASAVRAYKDAVNGISPDVELLKSVFSRSGFTKGYLEGKRNISMFGNRTKEDVLSANDVLSDIANSCRNEAPLIEIGMHFSVKQGEKASLTVTDGKNTVTVEGSVPEAAIKAPLSEESAVRSLGKLGSTFFYTNNIVCDIEDSLMLRASEINALRRDAVEALIKLRGERKGYSYREYKKTLISKKDCSEPKLLLMFKRASQIPEGISCHRLILPSEELINNTELISRYKDILAVRLSSLIYPLSEEKTKKELRYLFSLGVKYAYCDNIGAVALALSSGFEVIGGTLLNIINSDAAELYFSLGVKEIVFSPEISFKELKNIGTHCKTGIAAYGYMPLMHFRCCPLQSENGCGDCKGVGVLTDRMNEKFRVLCEKRQYSVLYNTVPLYIGDKNAPPSDYQLLSFVFENKDEVAGIIRSFTQKKALAGKKTAGLYERDIL